MKYFLKTTVGLGLLIASIVAISYSVYQLLQIGTCASGGPYVSARECPAGTERIGLAIPIAVFVMLFGAALYATRGAAPGSSRKGDGAYALALIWSGLFLGIAFACFWGVWGPDANPGPGGKAGGLIVGFVFVPLGLLGVIPMLAAGKAARAASEASGIGVGDAIKLARDARKTDFGELVGRIQEQAPTAPAPAAPAGGGAVNPVAAIAHLIAIVAGIWGGLWIMDRIAPDLPDASAEPGVTATAPEDVPGDTEESLFRQTPLFWALEQLSDQLAAAEQLVRLRVEPGSLTSESREAQDGLIDPGDVRASAPEYIVSQIAEERPRVTLDRVRYMELVATENGPRWYVQLVSDDPELSPPWTYTADFEGDLLGAGSRQPAPLAED